MPHLAIQLKHKYLKMFNEFNISALATIIGFEILN